MSEDTTINVTGQAEVTTEPDLVRVNFAVTASDEDQRGVRDQINERSNRLYEALIGYGIDDDDITTTNFNIRENQRHNEEADELETVHHGQYQYQVDVEPEEVGEVIDCALDNGANEVQRLQHTLSEETHEEQRDKALTQAVEKARADAEIVANAEDMEVRAVENMTVEHSSGRPMANHGGQMYALSAGSVEDISTNIQNTDVTVSASVSVEYNCKHLI